jgi:hypothetical protein
MFSFFKKNKFFFYVSNIVLIIEYLFPGSFMGCFVLGDCKTQLLIVQEKVQIISVLFSLNHFIAFLFISLIGFFTYTRSGNLNLIILYLIFLSLILEFIHFIIPSRSFEFSDIFGNLFGVITVLIFSYFFKNYDKFKK